MIALGLSLFAHAVLVLLPYLGSGGQSAYEGGSRFRYRIHATLAPETGAGTSEEAIRNEVAGQSAAVPAAAAPSADSPVSNTNPGAAGPGGQLPFAAPLYYTTDQLSKRPQMLPDAPLDEENLRVLAASGKLVLKLWINDRGEVATTEVERSDMPAEFSQSVTAAFMRTRFSPGERGGLPVGSIIRVEINYAEERRSAP